MCLRKKKDNPNKDSADVTHALPIANIETFSDTESQTDSVRSAVFDRTYEGEIDAGNEKLKNRAIVEASNDFATRLMKEFLTSESLCISPISISFLLAMSLAGAKRETKAEIVKVLGKGCSLGEIEAYFVDVKTVFQQLSELEILHHANRIYYDHSVELLKTYKEKVARLYGSDALHVLDFSYPYGTAKEINEFVEEITKGNMRNVICAHKVSGSHMILLNALDFQGKWKAPFYQISNVIREFHLLNGNTKKIEMMTNDRVTASDFFYCENDEMQRICLPYKILKKNAEYDYEKNSSHEMDAGELSMYIFLPRERKGLPKLVKDLDGEKFLKWLRLKPLQNYRQEEPICDIKYRLYIKIPKFTIRTDVQLADTLEKIGLEHYFSKNADFSGTSNVPLHANSFIHKTFIKTEECGIDALAPTCGYGKYNKNSAKLQHIEKEFHADRPFLYAIVSQKQHVLFIGTVMDADEANEEELNARKKQIDFGWWGTKSDLEV